MFQIRARARAPLLGAPARALVKLLGLALSGQPRLHFPHHPHFQSIHITVTQAHSEKPSSDCCSNSLSMPPAHFLGQIACTLTAKRQYACPQSSGSIESKRSQLTSSSELKQLWPSSAARKQFQCVICITSQEQQKSFGARLTPQSPIRFLGSLIIE